MVTQASFIKHFINNYPETLQQIEQFRLKLETLIVDKDIRSAAIKELVTTVNQIDRLFEQFNNNQSRDSEKLLTKSQDLEEVSLLINNLVKKHQETYSKKLNAQLIYYAKCFSGLSKKFELLSLVNQTREPSDLVFIQMILLLGEYLNITWEIFPEEVMMYGALARVLAQKDDTSTYSSDLLLNNAINSYIKIAQESSQKAIKVYAKQIAIEETKKIFDKLIKTSPNSTEANLLIKAKNTIEELPHSIDIDSKNTITINFDASSLGDEESEHNKSIKLTDTESTQSIHQFADWDREAQIKKNQKAIEYFKQKLENRPYMTEEEIKQSQEDFRILQEIIENSR